MHENLILVGAGLYGATIGSFLNVCIFRLPRRCLRLWKPKLSFCPRCHATVRWHDNLPLLSYLVLGGKCRACRAPIPLRYFLVELATAAIFIVVATQTLLAAERQWALAVVEALFASALLVCAVVDYDHRIIPDEIDIPGFLLAPLAAVAAPALIPDAVTRPQAAVLSIAGAAFGAAAIWTIGFVGAKVARKEAMGFGDVKLLAMIGGFTGWQGALAAIGAGSMLGSLYGVPAILLGRRDHAVPFGPFLSLGAAAFVLVPPFRELVLSLLPVTPWVH